MSIARQILPVLSLSGLAAGCAAGSPLAEVGPDVRVVADPDHVSSPQPFTLTLITWNHLDTLGEAVDAGQITASLDGVALAIDRAQTGEMGNGDSYQVTFVRPPVAARDGAPGTSTLEITDGQVTWSAEVDDLFTHDLQATDAHTFVWPSAATTEPWSNIEWACAGAGVAAACTGDPGISVAGNTIHVDQDADRVWAERIAQARTTGDSSPFDVRVRNLVEVGL